MCVIKNTRRAREFSFVNITIITQKFKKFLYLLSLIIIYRNVSLLRDSIILNREEESSSHSLNAFLNAFLLIVSRRERRYSSRCPATFVVQSVDDREEKKRKEEKRKDERMNSSLEHTTTIANQSERGGEGLSEVRKESRDLNSPC